MKSVIILGAGYSVVEGINQDLWLKLKESKIEVWSLNSCFKAMPYLPTKELFVDRDFWRNEADNLQQLYLKGVSIITRDMGVLIDNRPEIIKYGCTRIRTEFTGLDGIKKNLIYSGRMGLVGIFALHLAVCEYDVIYLLGYDFGVADMTSKRTHWYQDQIPQLNIKSYGAGRPEVYYPAVVRDEPQRIEVCKDVENFGLFAHLGRTIYNVSSQSHISYFPKIDYLTMFQKLGV